MNIFLNIMFGPFYVMVYTVLVYEVQFRLKQNNHYHWD